MGLGFKDWTAGDVPTAAEFDGYLQRQTVMVFASTSARDTALSGNLEEGMQAYTTDTDTHWFYNGAAWRVRPGTVITKVSGSQIVASTDSAEPVTVDTETLDLEGMVAVGSANFTFTTGGMFVVSIRTFLSAGTGSATFRLRDSDSVNNTVASVGLINGIEWGSGAVNVESGEVLQLVADGQFADATISFEVQIARLGY